MRLSTVEKNSAAVDAALNSGEMNGSFSQFGEDGVLWWIFESQWNGFYVDVGCYNPYRYSNTAALHLYRKWSGINIDADQRAIEKFNLARPQDVNICSGVGSEEGMFSMALFEDGAVNSLDPTFHSAGSYDWMRKGSVDVEVKTLKRILSESMPQEKSVDFLNIDVEGFDYEVLTSNDWDLCNPKAIAIEAHGFDISQPTKSKSYQYLGERGYRLLSHVLVTSIYIKI